MDRCPTCGKPTTAVGKFVICADHGQVGAVATEVAAAAGAKRGLSVFISYGRADALEFASRLSQALHDHGHRSWLDLNDIKKGGAFDVHIERGIRASDVVAAVMTRHSLREESVCRDEIIFALGESRVVLPLRVDPDPLVKPSLLLARRNWIDFTAGFEQGIQALLRFLSGDLTALRPPRVGMVSGVAPLDFSVEIARYSAGFTGRKWLVREIDRWLESGAKRAFVLVAGPGVGKSAFLAWLSRTRPQDVAAIHFCTHQSTRSLDPREFVANLVSQLHAEIPGFAEALETRRPEERRRTASDAFRELVVEVARSLPAPGRPWLVLVDSLDEALRQEGETVVDVLQRQAGDLPSWLRIVATTRPEEEVLSRVRSLDVFELSVERSENLDDVAEYVAGRVASPRLSAQLGARASAVRDRVGALASGNFLCAEKILEALEDGALDPADLGQLAAGLAGFYDDAFRRRFPDPSGFALRLRPLMRPLLAARAPLDFATLVLASGLGAEATSDLLREIRGFLRQVGTGEAASYAPFHKSLRDWLTDRGAAGDYWCDVAEGHARLVTALLPAWKGSDYAIRHLPAHLIGIRRLDDLERLLTDGAFLEAKAEAGLVFELAEDFREAARAMPFDRPGRRSIELLGDAVARQGPFVARYPRLLFQCCWNLAWWYDCPEAEHHYTATAAGGGLPPWVRPGPFLFEIMERWRADRVRRGARTPWVRLLRPPAVPLGSALRAVLRGYHGVVYGVAFAPDGARIASGASDNNVRISDAITGRATAVLRGHKAWVADVAFSPDGTRVASGSWDETVRIWDAATGQEITVLRGHQGAVSGVAFSPDGTRVVSSSTDKTLRIWQVATGHAIFVLEGHKHWVAAVAFSPDGTRVLSGSWDKTIRLWDAATGRETAVWGGHEDWVRSVGYSPDGTRVVSGSDDQTVRVWDVAAGRETVVLRGHERRVYGVAFSPDGTCVVSGSQDRTVRLWDTTTGRETAVLRGHEDAIWRVAFSPDGARVVSGSADGTLRLWDTAPGRETAVLRGHESAVGCVAFSPDGRRVVSVSNDGSLRLWDAATGREGTILRGHEDWVRAVAYSSDGTRIVSGADDKTIRLWDAETGRETAVLRGHEDWVLDVGFSGDGTRIVSGSSDRTVRLWDVAAGRELGVFRGHENWVYGVAFSPDGTLVVSGSEDATVRIWDVATRREISVLRGHDMRVTGVAFSPDGTRVVSRSRDRTVRIWDTASGALLTVLSGTADVKDVARSVGAARPFALAQAVATIWRTIRSETVIAAFEEPLAEPAASPSHVAWAGAAGSHVHILTLEDLDA